MPLITNGSHMHKLNWEQAFGVCTCQPQNEDETKIKVKKKGFSSSTLTFPSSQEPACLIWKGSPGLLVSPSLIIIGFYCLYYNHVRLLLR